MQREKAFLGTGWNFPLRVDEQTGRIMTVSQEEDIAQSINIILSTKMGERVMRPDFGCDLHEYTFSNIQSDEIAEIRRSVKEALRRWETRVVGVEVNADTSELHLGRLLLNIEYRVRATNTPYNLVFPYYITEGV